MLRFLTSIREHLEFGVGDLAGSKETFDSIFAKNLASIVVESVRTSYWRIYDLISKITMR